MIPPYRDSFKNFANVLHLTLIEKSYVLNRKSIEKGLPTARHPLKIHFPKSKSIENPIRHSETFIQILLPKMESYCNS